MGRPRAVEPLGSICSRKGKTTEDGALAPRGSASSPSRPRRSRRFGRPLQWHPGIPTRQPRIANTALEGDT